MKPWVTRALRSQPFYLLLVAVAISITATSVNPRFLRWSNWISILEQISVPGLVAVGATILIVSGNFDISVGANIGLTACVIAMLINRGVPAGGAMLAGVAVAVLAAVFVGGASIVLRAPSFIVSLACIGVFQGIALAMTEGSLQTVYGRFELFSGQPWLGLLPPLFAVSLAGYLVAHFMLTYTRLGRRVYAIGSNPRAAYLSGIAVNRSKLVFFAINGLYVGAAAILLLSRVGGAKPDTGAGMELRAIGAVVIGGAPMSGGKGKIIGTFLGVLLMVLISNMLNMLNVNANYQSIAFGLLILLALGIGGLSRRSKDTGGLRT